MERSVDKLFFQVNQNVESHFARKMKLTNFIRTLFLFETCLFIHGIDKLIANNNTLPVIVITWDYTNATAKGWDVIYNQNRSALDAIEEGITLCEEEQCRNTVGFGGSPDENGETTLDAMIMDGVTMDVGAVASLRTVKRAISVARKVLHHTKHTLLGGKLATYFAIEMGFKEESLTTNLSSQMWKEWKANNCQPNYWKNVEPDSMISCGPYRPKNIQDNYNRYEEYTLEGSEENHDTIGMLAIDSQGRIAAGTSTNGLNHKIPGRVGDSPIPGAGAYADQEAGAAACTGDGDIMMRFLPSFLAVEEMRRGATPDAAARKAINRIIRYYPTFFGAVIALNNKGEFGAACNGMNIFPFYVANPALGTKLFSIDCSNVHCYKTDTN